MSTKFKSIYEFSVLKKEKAPVTTETIDADGKPIKITKEEETEVPYHFAIKRPSRDLVERGELFYSATVGEGMQAGLMSRALVVKRYANDGGVFSESEKELFAEIAQERKDVEEQLEVLRKKTTEERTDEEKEKYKELEKKTFRLNRELQEFDIHQQTLLENTAEDRARTKTILWHQLELLHKKDGEDWIPVFPLKSGVTDVRSTHKERLESYDELVEAADDDNETARFWGEVFAKSLQVITLWYYRRITKQEEIDALIKEIEKNNLS